MIEITIHRLFAIIVGSFVTVCAQLSAATLPPSDLIPVTTADTVADRDRDRDGVDDATEMELLNQFSPFYLFSRRGAGGGWGEHYNPADPIWYIRRSELLSSGDEDSSSTLSNAILKDDPGAILSVADLYSDPTKRNFHINPLKRISDGKWRVSYFEGNRASEWIDVADSHIGIQDVLLGDFNGDGKTDVLAVWGGKWHVSYSDGHRFGDWHDFADSSLEIHDIL